jgi:ketosteroid isomerase-like protein
VPEGILRGGYEALERGDAAPLLDLLADDFEWTEPELPGYPLAGVHRGAEGLASGVLGPLAELLDGLTFSLEDVVVGGGREVVTGVMRGTPEGASDEWELPFAHVWVVAEGRAVAGCAYFDRSRLTLAAGRRQLADVADELLDQAAEIRLQWSRLGDALRAAGVDAADEGDLDVAAGADDEPVAGAASLRLVAVDMAQDGSTREEVDAYLRGELDVDEAEAEAILAEVFSPAGDVAVGEDAAEPLDEASRLTRLFARNRG